MSESRRLGDHPNEFSREFRSERGGGTLDDAWGCRVVDIDEFYALIEGELFRVTTAGRVWAWYRRPAEIVAVAEQKNYDDLQQAWDVTRSFATVAGIEGFRVVVLPDGRRRVTDLSGDKYEYSSTRDFVEARIRPLIEKDYPF